MQTVDRLAINMAYIRTHSRVFCEFLLKKNQDDSWI